MAESDWTYLNDGLDANTVKRGVTAGIVSPGYGDFVFAFNSMTLAEGAVTLFVNQPDFTDMPLGGSISAAIQRGPGGGPTGFAPFIYLCCGGTSVNDQAYLLGLSDEDPHRITLRKGSIVAGIPDSEGSGALISSSDSFLQGTYLHLRLEAIVNSNGDVVLNVFQNDFEANPLGITPPDWQPISGMPSFVDDTTAINSGSAPLTSGRAGFGFAVKDVTRRAFFDHIVVERRIP